MCFLSCDVDGLADEQFSLLMGCSDPILSSPPLRRQIHNRLLIAIAEWLAECDFIMKEWEKIRKEE